MKGFIKALIVGMVLLCVSLIWAQEPKINSQKKPQISPEKTPSKMRHIIFKPDLVVTEIQVQEIDRYPKNTTPERVRARITVTVKNRSVSSATEDFLTPEGQRRQCAGSFKVLLEWTDNPQQGYKYLCEAGVNGLSGGQTTSFYCYYWFPYYASVKLRAIVDHLNWIDESDENNNTLERGYWVR